MTFKHTMEFVGVSAVVLGLIFVGLELRQNTASMQAATSLGLLEISNEWSLAIVGDAAFVDVLIRAEQSLDELTAVEQRQYLRFIVGQFSLWEEAFDKHFGGTLEEASWRAWDNSQRLYICMESSKIIWGIIEFGFNEGFRAHVNGTTSEQCAAFPEPNLDALLE